MKNVTNLADRYYNSFINQPSDWHFFLGLSDYVEFIAKTPETDQIANSVVRQRIKDEKRLKKYENKVVNEIKQAKEKLFRRIKNKKIDYQELNNLIQTYQEYEDEKIISSESKAQSLALHFEDIIDSLYRNNHSNILKGLVAYTENPKVIKYDYSKILPFYRKEKKEFEDKEEIVIWGAWDNLVLAYIAVKRGKEEFEKYKKNKASFIDILDLVGLLGEMKKIKDNKESNNLDKAFIRVQFIKENYIGYATRFHNYLVQKLAKNNNTTLSTISFNENGVLNFNNSKILISKSKNTNPYYLLKVLFKEKNKIWHYDEIYIEMFGDEYDKLKWKTIYNAGYDVNEKIAKETTIKDFLILSKTTIKINNKYLK